MPRKPKTLSSYERTVSSVLPLKLFEAITHEIGLTGKSAAEIIRLALADRYGDESLAESKRGRPIKNP